ncbi:SDR family oxidoreductase [Rarobacter incanus]|uniref:NAD(P)H dehydrogenase (Quinone) n=1 Tax=Rarobacter incanus TaxID=153494 RepID=A0A542SPB3_9MICO|nr:SDR family oxidoreductase [Rarobacter incanus]TQK76461.1 NAD(P)H dehydrogenase (quinone) [Rarobacter incanus]
MTIAVAGSTGHLGRLTIEHLVAGGTDPTTIVALARDTLRAQQAFSGGIQIRAADYDDTETLEPALSGVDTLVLISGNDVGARVVQHRAVIDAAKEAGVNRVVYTSMLGASAALINPMGASHAATENDLRESGMAYTLMRNGWYSENFIDTARQAVATGEILGSAGDGKVASAARDDFASALAIVAANDGHDYATYELGGDTAWSYADLAKTVTEISGRDVTYRDVSEREHADTLVALAGLDEGTAAFIATIDQSIRAGELGTVTHDLSVLIGRPTTPIARTLADALSAE